MKKKYSNLHIFFCVIMFAALGCLIAALSTFSYNFSVSFEEMWANNMATFILLATFVAFNLMLIISSVCLRVKHDEMTYGEVALAFQITVVVLFEVVFIVPIFILWIAEKIHDAASSRNKEMP